MKLAISKKLLAVAVVFALLLSAIFAIPTYAEETGAAEPLKVKPLSSITATSGGTATNTSAALTRKAPLDFSGAYGAGTTFTAQSAPVADSNVTGSGRKVQVPSLTTEIYGNYGLLIYVETNKATDLATWSTAQKTGTTTKNYVSMKAGQTVYLLADGATEWTAYTAENSTSDTKGIIRFDSAFKGFIKIPMSTMRINNSGSGNNPITNRNWYYLNHEVYFNAYAGTLTATVGPVFMIAENSTSTTIVDTTVEPMKVKPISRVTGDVGAVGPAGTTTYNFKGAATTTPNKVVRPSDFLTEAKGINFQLIANTYTDDTANSGNGIHFFPSKTYVAGNDALMIYVDVPKASKMLLWIKAPYSSDTKTAWAYTKRDTPAYLLADGATKWTKQTMTTTSTTQGFGFVHFGTDGFKGYVKVPFSSLTLTAGSFTTADLHFSEVQVKFSGYESTLSASAGPIFLVSEDSVSAEIIDTTYVDVPNEVTPVNKITHKAGASISANVANIFTIAGYTGQPTVSIPLDFSMSRGVKSSLADAADINLTAGGITSVANKLRFYHTATPVAGSDGLMFYIETDKAISFSFWTTMKSGTSSDYVYLGLGKTYYLLGENDMMWKDGTTTTGTTRGIINLEAGFKGLIKVPFASLASLNGRCLTNSSYVLIDTYTYFANYDGVANLTVGPMFVVNNETISPNVKDRTTGTTPVKGNFVATGTHEDGCKGPVDIYNALIDGVNAFGIKITAASSQDKCAIHKTDDTEIATNEYLANSQVRVEYRQAASSKIAADQNGMMFYVKTTAANQFLLEMTITGLSDTFVMTSGASYEVLPVGATEWTEKKLINGYDSDKNPYNVYGALNFEEAFEGYVRIPFKAFPRYPSSGFDGKSIELLHIRMKGIGVGSVTGTNYGEATFGPIMFYDIPDDTVNMKTRLTVAEGDVNDDQVVNLCDIVYFANYMNGNERYPVMADAINFGTDDQDRYITLRQNRLEAITPEDFE